MSMIIYIALGLSVLLGLGLFMNAYFKGQKVLKKISQNKKF